MSLIGRVRRVETEIRSIRPGGGSAPSLFPSSDIDASGNIIANAVRNSDLVDVPTHTIKGRLAAGTGDPGDLTADQSADLLQIRYAKSFRSPFFATAGVTSTRALASEVCVARYMGRAMVPIPSAAVVQARYETTLAAILGVGGWAEMGLGVGPLVVGGDSFITVVAASDISTELSLVNKTGTNLTIDDLPVAHDDDLWLLIAVKAATPAILRAQSIADHLSSGSQATRSSPDTPFQPTLMLGAGPQEFSIEADTVLAPWFDISY